MKVIHTIDEIREQTPCVLALGAFDGLHRGHMAVIQSAVEWAKKLPETQPAVFTFQASPRGGAALLTAADKEQLLREAGVERLYSMAFSELRDMEAEAFVEEVLLNRCGAKRLCCGEDFRFGKDARGDVTLLAALCKGRAKVTVAAPVMEEGEKVSSTRIREAAERGEIALCNRLLGRCLNFANPVIHGNHIGGPLLGTPTLNQELPEGFVQPRFGVYASYALVREEGEPVCHYGVTNIGVKPTVGSDRVLSETWLPEFSGDLYGQHVRLFLLDFLRPEKKFDSLPALREEILKNAETAKAIAERTRKRFDAVAENLTKCIDKL